VIIRELITKLGFEVDDSGLNKANVGLENLKKKLIGFSVAVGGITVLGKMAAEAAKLEQALASLAEVFEGTDAKFKEVSDGLRARAEQMSTSMNVSSEEIAKNFVNVIDAGGALGTKAFDELSNASLKLAKVMRIDTAQSVEILANITEQLTGNLENATYVSDGLVRAGQLGRTSATQVAAALSVVGDTAQSAKIPFEDLTAVVAKLQSTGLTGAKAGMKLRGVLLNLYDSAGPAAKALGNLGVNVFDQSGEARPFLQVIEEIQAALRTLGTQERIDIEKMIGGPGGADTLAKLFRGGTKGIKDWSKEIKNSSGTLDKSYERSMATAIEQVGRMTKGLGNLVSAMGEPFLAPIAKAARYMADLIEKLQKFIEENKGIISPIMRFVGALLIVGAAVTGFQIVLALLRTNLIRYIATTLIAQAVTLLWVAAAILAIAIVMDLVAAIGGYPSVTGDAVDALDKWVQKLYQSNSAMAPWIAGIKVGLEVFVTLSRLILDGVKYMSIFAATLASMDFKGFFDDIFSFNFKSAADKISKPFELAGKQIADIMKDKTSGYASYQRLLSGKSAINPEGEEARAKKDEEEFQKNLRKINERAQKDRIVRTTFEGELRGKNLTDDQSKKSMRLLETGGMKSTDGMDSKKFKKEFGLSRTELREVFQSATDKSLKQISVMESSMKPGAEPDKIALPERAVNAAKEKTEKPSPQGSLSFKKQDATVDINRGNIFNDFQKLLGAREQKNSEKIPQDIPEMIRAPEATRTIENYTTKVTSLVDQDPRKFLAPQPSPIAPKENSPAPLKSPMLFKETYPPPTNEKHSMLAPEITQTSEQPRKFDSGKNYSIDPEQESGVLSRLKKYSDFGSQLKDTPAVDEYSSGLKSFQEKTTPMDRPAASTTNNNYRTSNVNQQNQIQVSVNIPPGTSQADGAEMVQKGIQEAMESERRRAYLDFEPVFAQ